MIFRRIGRVTMYGACSKPHPGIYGWEGRGDRPPTERACFKILAERMVLPIHPDSLSSSWSQAISWREAETIYSSGRVGDGLCCAKIWTEFELYGKRATEFFGWFRARAC